jgi:precorrin-6B methylase 2
MPGFLTEVKDRGWERAIIESTHPEVKGLYLFTHCPFRTDGAFYLSLNNNSTVLDLGSGWGSYTFGLSPRVKTIVAADSNLESLRFISLRAQQEKRDNVLAVKIDPLDFGKIPFADELFA